MTTSKLSVNKIIDSNEVAEVVKEDVASIADEVDQVTPLSTKAMFREPVSTPDLK